MLLHAYVALLFVASRVQGLPSDITAFHVGQPAGGGGAASTSTDEATGQAARNSSSDLNATEPFYEFYPTYNGHRLSPESVYKTLISAYDWAQYVWAPDRSSSSKSKFEPENWYDVQLRISRRPLSPSPVPTLGREFIATAVEAVGFHMREDDRFQEVDFEVTNHGLEYARISVRAKESTGGHQNPGGELSVAGGAHNNASGPLLFEADSVSRRHRKRGSSPRTYNTFVETDIVGGANIGGDEAMEMDLMAALLYVGRLSFIEPRRAGYAINQRPDRCLVQVKPPRTLAQTMGEYVSESLVDLVEWQYRQKRASGSLKAVSARIFVSQRYSTSKFDGGKLDISLTR